MRYHAITNQEKKRRETFKNCKKKKFTRIEIHTDKLQRLLLALFYSFTIFYVELFEEIENL